VEALARRRRLLTTKIIIHTLTETSAKTKKNVQIRFNDQSTPPDATRCDATVLLRLVGRCVLGLRVSRYVTSLMLGGKVKTVYSNFYISSVR